MDDDIDIDGTTYSIVCSTAAGHTTFVSIKQFATPTEAHAAFNLERGDTPDTGFRGCPASSWDDAHWKEKWPYGQSSIRLWQADEWLIKVSAFDDTSYSLAPDPYHVSENIYQVGVAQGLFSNCQK